MSEIKGEHQMILLDNTVVPGGAVKIEVHNALSLLGYDVCVFGEKLVGEFYIPYKPDFSDNHVSLDQDTVYSLEYKDFNLWDLCKGSIGYECPAFLESYSDELLAEVELIYSRAMSCIDVCIDIYRRTRPSCVVVWGGMLIEPRVLQALAKQNNIPVYAIEFSFDKNKIHFDAAGRIGNEFSIVSDWPRLSSKNDQLADHEKHKVQSWISNNYSGKVRNQPKSELSSNTISFISSFNKAPLLLLGQCFIDTVVTYDNPHFKSSLEAYSRVIDACVKLQQPLIVKAHPGDKTEYKRRLKNLCAGHDEVLFIGDENNENVYRLMDASSAGIVINSQSGLEMAAKGKRIFLLGKSFYEILPNCTALKNSDSLQSELSSFLSLSPLESKDLEICLYFLHYLLFELLVDISKSSLETAKQISPKLSDLTFDASKRHSLIATTPKIEKNKQLRIVIVHPSPSWGGSGYYLQDLSAELVKLGHRVLVLSEGTCIPNDEGVRWMRLSFQGQLLSETIKSAVNELQPNILVEVGVRTKPIRAALEIIMRHNPLVIVQGEDDEFQPFSKYYPEPNPSLMDSLDKPFLFDKDIAEFLKFLDLDNFIKTFSSPSAYRWVEPCLRSLMYHSADRFSAIWYPMQERLEGKFHKPCDLLPPVLRMENFDLSPVSEEVRKRKLELLKIPEDSIVYFVNGTVYRYSEEYQLFIRSMIKLQKYSPKPIALLVCGNEGDTNLEGKIKHFKSLGRLGDREYINYIKISDVICAPGVPDTFNKYRLSSRLLKGMVFAKPIFTFKTGFAELLHDNEDGFFTHTSDPDEWFQVLKKTLNPNLRSQVGKSGFSLVEKHFLAGNVAKKLEQQWVKSLAEKKSRLNPKYSRLISPSTMHSTYEYIYNTHVPIQQRVLGGIKINFNRFGIFEKLNRFCILGLGMERSSEKIKSFHYCSGFSIPIERNASKITLQFKYEPGNVDDKCEFYIYDAEGLLEPKIEKQGTLLSIEIHSKYSDFIIFKPRYKKQMNGRKYFYELLNIDIDGIIGEHSKADAAIESIKEPKNTIHTNIIRNTDWRRQYICPIATPIVRKIGGESAVTAYLADPVIFFRNLKNPYHRAIGRILHPR
ncbi:glycosyltransferase [Pseudovibrio sp. JE062]|uniref:capsular polysaccharide export protein, LipB/KpsS family n=1 Tax=Pseudovibrio sp. JE062 TaxID=439495 RepID=UPI00030AD4E9|nr:hypothetical protein [Pseudovibrio sp. JE062]